MFNWFAFVISVITIAEPLFDTIKEYLQELFSISSGGAILLTIVAEFIVAMVSAFLFNLFLKIKRK